jgi:hypothetical protein
MDEGSCPKVHSDELKENFQKSGDLCIFDYQLEKEFTRRLAEADRIIKVISYQYFLHSTDF